jgi:hypothetical protein
MNSSSNICLQLSGLERLSQLIINSGGTNHLTIDSLIVKMKYFFVNIKSNIFYCFSIH